MGDSSRWFTRSLSQPVSSGNEEDYCYRALTSSVSFGRYASESDLDWGKWSCFTQNRRLEEAQKLSKPGSVAAMKAYFEARYKRFASKKTVAVVPCKENEACNCSSPPSVIIETRNNSQVQPHLAKSGKDVSRSKEKDFTNGEVVLSVDLKCSSIVPGEHETGNALNQRALVKIEQFVTKENSTDLDSLNQLENVQKHRYIGLTQQKKSLQALLKDNTDKGDLTSLSLRKPASSSSKLSVHGSASKIQAPGTPTIILKSQKESSSTPKSNMTPKDSTEKRRSPFESLQRSISFASVSGAANKTSSPILDSIRNSRIIKGFCKSSKDSSTRLASDRACSHGGATHNSETPHRKNMSYVESVSAGRKTRSSTVFSPFRFRCEERAAIRKEKLENKLTEKETEKAPLQTKSKYEPSKRNIRIQTATSILEISVRSHQLGLIHEELEGIHPQARSRILLVHDLPGDLLRRQTAQSILQKRVDEVQTIPSEHSLRRRLAHISSTELNNRASLCMSNSCIKTYT